MATDLNVGLCRPGQAELRHHLQTKCTCLEIHGRETLFFFIAQSQELVYFTGQLLTLKIQTKISVFYQGEEKEAWGKHGCDLSVGV